jgi:DHA1 family multidrug resistance protein-like MFS transporter
VSRWKRNLIVLCAAQLATMIGFSSYGSFIPYYLQEIGVSSYDLALAWTAAFNSGAAIAMMIASPIWGSLADRYGRKPMLVRATAAGAVLAGLMGLVTSPAQLIVIRVLQGALCGTMGAAMTLVATETPEDKLASSLGIMQTAQYVGMAIGPLIGGLLADATSYRTVFPFAALLMALALVAIILWVHEKSVKSVILPDSKARLASRGIKGMLSANALLLIIALGSTSFAMAVLSPIMPFYIQSMVSDSARLATIAGLVTSASAVTTAVSALWIGRLGDRIGYKQVLVFCVVGVALIFIPQGFIRSPWQLLVLRAFQGVFIGGILPTANALLARSTRHENRGTIFGLATSAQSGGNALGPVVGAAVAGSLGLASGFFLTAGIFGVIALLLMLFVKRNIGSSTATEETPSAAVTPE